MIDLVQFEDNAGDPVLINPALVRWVTPLPMGGAIICFGDEGFDHEVTVEGRTPEIAAKLTGKPWLAPDPFERSGKPAELKICRPHPS